MISSETGLHNQCLHGRHSIGFSGTWLDASSQPLPHPGWRVFHRSRVCHQRTGLGIDRAPGRFRRGTALGSDLGQFTLRPIIPAMVLGGLLVLLVGANFVFALNAAVIPLLRARLSPDCLTLSANLLLVLVYVLMALIRQTEAFFVVAALAGIGWTMSASELWVAAQRRMPTCAPDLRASGLFVGVSIGIRFELLELTFDLRHAAGCG